MRSVTARRLSIAAAFAVLVGSFAIFRLMSQLKEEPPRKPETALVKEVEAMVVQNGPVPMTLEVQGELVAFDKIEIFAEVSGMLEENSRPFKVGSFFPKNSVLARIDDEEAQLALLAQKSNLLNAITQLMPDLKIDYPQSFSNWNAYLEHFDLEKPVRPFPQPVSQQEKYFIASRNLYSQYYNIKSAEERLTKYTIYAPFSGVLTQAGINPGALVRTGQKLGELMNTAEFELEATVPLTDLKYIRTGGRVILSGDGTEGQWTGRVKRISNQVDPGTQTVKVFIGVSGDQLKEGMYLSGEVESSRIEKAVELPRELLVNQNSVYEVEGDSLLRLRQVEVVRITPEVAIARGLKDGAAILKTRLPDAFDGMNVRVISTVPQPEAANARVTAGNR